jgi:hypothetical protein
MLLYIAIDQPETAVDNQPPAEQNGEKPEAASPPPDAAKTIDPKAASPATAEQLTEVEEQMSGFEKSTLRWAKTAVFMSGLAAIFVCAQWWEMHSGGKDTHDLAVAAGNQATWTQHLSDNMKTQADRTQELADRMKDQAERTKTIADQAIIQAKAARSGAQTAKDTLHVSERAYIVNSNIQVDWNRKVIFIPIENRGRIPSGQVHIILHVSRFTNNLNVGTSMQANWTEFWLSSLTDTAPVTSPQIAFDPVQAKSGVQYFHVGIEIEYNDGFPDTPPRRTEGVFCSFHREADSFLFGPCPITNMLELLKKSDEYPNPKYMLTSPTTPDMIQPPSPPDR